MIKGALVKGNRRYRLWRIWNEKEPLLLYILLNPSYADATSDDRTVMKLIRFSKNFGFGGFYLGNLHSYITPYPAVLKNKILNHDNVNLSHLKKMTKKCEKVVFGWGKAGNTPQWLKEIVKQPYCFGFNQNGTPKHPLYLPYSSELKPFQYKGDVERKNGNDIPS